MISKTKNEHIKKALILDLSLILALAAAIAFSTVKFENTCKDVRQSVLRLHVIANSDSDFDQSLKLKVRDALLDTGAQLFSGEVTAKSAQETAENEIAKLEEAARQVLKENDCDDSVKIEVGESYFPTRTYESVTLPAGKYEAVKVIIGEGKGHNWWCVMFPPMCLPAAQGDVKLDDVLSADAVKLVGESPKYEVRFKIVEWWQSIFASF